MRPLFPIAVLLAAVLALAGCSSGSDPAQATTQAEGPAASSGGDEQEDEAAAPEEQQPDPEPEPQPQPQPQPEADPEVVGKNTLLIGHSFFRPAAHHFERFSEDAGLSEHVQQLYFSGGSTGTPIRLWNDTAKRADIQAMLDAGDIELFGMTYTDDHPEPDGYLNWVQYALDQNPDTEFFIAMPWMRDPETVTGTQHQNLWHDHHEDVIHPIINTLRSSYPDKVFFCVPYGATAHQLQILYESGNLPDVTALTGAENSAVYTDALGHPGRILEIAGALVWLQAIYDVDLAEFDNGEGYQTDLNTMAADILAAHDPAYDRF